MSQLFISHSSQDDGFVRDLRAALADHGQQGWIDSRELRGGDPLWPEIQNAIEKADAYAVVVSTDALQSKWVGKELRLALELQKQRGKDKFPVTPLSLDGTKLGVLEEFFGDEPLYIPVSSGAGGIEAAVHPLLVALGKRDPIDVSETPQPKAEPLEELVLELTDLKFREQDGIRRASDRARLVYEPATPGQPDVHSAQPWRLVAPIGPIEAAELTWYLEKYAIWPSHYFADRARKVEQDLVKWGQLLHQSAMPPALRENVMTAWAKIDDHAGRRFSVHVDPALEAGTPEAEVNASKEAATVLLGLPWELLHDGHGYLFQGATPTRVRRRLPATESFDVPVVAPSIRILLITARPEDESCGFIDHRVSALPLVEAMEALPGLVEIHVLNPPTLPDLREELDRARAARKSYHVVHFDGHGTYDKTVGLGGLCFEHPEDSVKLTDRRHVTVFTNELGPLLRHHRIPLVFLEACQTAQAENTSESVASELLKVGVASVVAMSHSVLVETARRFVAAFYRALADGRRVGDAMLEGQRELEGNKSRGRVFGESELLLHDWFVPVLFQEKDDPQLFQTIPAKQTVKDFQTALTRRLGNLPPVPETGFIGRSRELLALQRLLRLESWAIIRGQGGEGKTALAAEFARWMVRSQQIRRAAFVSVEGLEKNIAETILDQLGHQLVQSGFSSQADCHGDLEIAEQKIMGALREQPTLLVLDNMESVLLPPFLQDETPDALSEEAGKELETILALAARLLKAGETRLIFTSRETLPPPFDAMRNRLELHQLDKDDAVKLVERALNTSDKDAGYSTDAAREEFEQLVEVVQGHARTLALLAPALRERGVEQTRVSLVELMVEMEQKFPGNREKSVFASVELSLRRMSPANRDRVRVLGVFHGGFKREVIGRMMRWEEADVASLATELVQTGLATLNRYNYLTLNPALCPYLRGRLESAERQTLVSRWVSEMRGYVGFLDQQSNQNAKLAVTLTLLELPNLFALLDLVQRAGDSEAIIGLTTSLYSLLQNLGKPRLMERVGQARDAAAMVQGDVWNHARFEAARTRIDEQLASRKLHEASKGAQQLLQRARTADVKAYPGADYDLAVANFLLARVLKTKGDPEQALPLLDEARQGFEAVAKKRAKKAAVGMAARCFSERGGCLLDLGRFDKAAEAYEESIRRGEQLHDYRGIAVDKGQLGAVLMEQHCLPKALVTFFEALERFETLKEPRSIAVIWHQIGMVYQEAKQPEKAENAYRKSLAIKVQLGDVAGQASTLGQFGTLYQMIVDSTVETNKKAEYFYRQSIEKYIEVGDTAGEGRQRNNLARLLLKSGYLDKARQEILLAIKLKTPFGQASELWKSWGFLADIETDASNLAPDAETKHNAFAAAVEAKSKAIDCYLAHRRDGGENHFGSGRIILAVTQSLLANDPATAASLLQKELPRFEAAGFGGFIRNLQAIVAGSRDRTLADAPELHYTMAAEILFMIETLERAEGNPAD